MSEQNALVLAGGAPADGAPAGGAAEESPALAVSNRTTLSDASAREGGRVGNEHTASVRDVHPGEHHPAEHAVVKDTQYAVDL
jgi:hypothetical protein